MKNTIIITIIILCLYPILQGQTQMNASMTQQINDFVTKAMSQTKVVPGLSIAIVQKDQIVYAKGFGYREVEQQQPVTPDTRFYIASMTKSITGMAAAQLAQKGVLNLNTPISEYYQDPAFIKSVGADNINLIDVMSHNHSLNNSGLQYRLAFIDEVIPEDFERVLFDFTTPTKQEFSYSNTSFNIAANIMEKVTGKSWREIVAEQVFAPIGMSHTTSYMSKASQSNYAFPYIMTDEKFLRLPIKSDGQMQSAGGLVTTATDMANWLLVNLNEGKLNRKQIIPPTVLEQTQTSYVNLERDYYRFQRKGYGLGLYHADYEGDLLLHHFGSFNGYMSHASFMPERELGVVVLSNEEGFGGRLPHLVAAYIYDLLLEKPQLQEKYDKELEDLVNSIEKRRARYGGMLKQKHQMLESAKTNPDNWQFQNADFIGNYYNPRIGDFEVTQSLDNTLMATYGSKTASLLPLQKDQFIIDWQITGYLSSPIQLDVLYDSNGKISGLSYGGREYKRLPDGTKTADLNPIFTSIRQEIQQLSNMDDVEKKKKVKQLVQTHYASGAITQPYLNALGYRYLGMKDTALAIAIFEAILDYYPNSANAYDSLGEALLKAGKKEEGLKNYQKSLELNPRNENARNILKEN